MGLLDSFLGRQAQPLLGTGMAAQAAQIIQSRPYQLHIQEMKAMGQQPLTPEQFMAQMMQQPNKGW